MGRLIDADDLIETEFQQIPEEYVNFLKDTVNQWPTVDAIPIEWIASWMGKHQGLEYCDWNLAVGTMVKDWEKENG